MKKVILLFILFMLPSTSVFAASSVVAIKEKEIENEELLFLRFDKDHQLSLVTRENKGEESIILRANSLHVEELKKNCDRWKLSYVIKNEIFVITDDTMEPGNAVLEKPSGIVKVGVDTGMEQVKKAILG